MRRFLLAFIICILRLRFISPTIPNCEKLAENESQCVKCKDNYFLFFHNLYCLPCDDKNYGQVGCGGNCDSSKYENDRFVYCNENECKEGFYNLYGLCFNCSVGSPGCKTCNVTGTISEDGQLDYKYSCQECLSSGYRLDEFGTCEKCEMDHCLECVFTNDYSNKECIQCQSGYYLSENKTCKSCYYVSIDYGHCYSCSDNLTDLKSAKCSCFSYSVLNENNTCTFCGDGCSKCILKEDKTPYCLQCYSGRFLNESECLRCPSGCSTCFLDDNNKIICTSCSSEYALLNGSCYLCGDGCSNCIIKENNKPSCLSCSYNYALNLNETCTSCWNVNSGEGCYRCKYNTKTDKYECFKCSNSYTLIKNQFKCLYYYGSNEVFLKGCLEANFIEENKYECLKCDVGFIPIINDKICREPNEISLSDNCLEAINIGNDSDPIYSCNKCSNETALITDLNNVSNCYERADNLVYCFKGEFNNKDEMKCNKCVSLANLNELNQICECNSDSFGIRNLFCYKCDDEIKGNPGCVTNEGCEYRISNDQLNCNMCKANYFQFSYGQCFSCSNKIEFCNKCFLDENYQFFCEECLDDFIFNRYEQSCQLICEEYPDISPGCMICNEEYKVKRKCQACKPGYYKTENELCIYCRSEKYGGPECTKCAKDEINGNIVCENCIGKYKALNSKGKCYSCQNKIFKECERCKFILNGDEEKLICTLCKEGYYLDSNGTCVNYINNLEKIKNCGRNIYQINTNFSIGYYSSNSFYYYFYDNDTDYFRYLYLDEIINNEVLEEILNINLKEINQLIKPICDYCEDGFYLNSENECIPIKIENCSLISMIKNNLYYACYVFCRVNQYPLVILNLNDSSNESSYKTISEIYNNFDIYGNSLLQKEIKNILNQTYCIDNSETSENNNLKNCVIALYLEKESKYICHVCSEGYFLYKETNECKKFDEDLNCEYENIGNETNQIFSCIKCRPNYYYYNYYNYYHYYYEYNQFSHLKYDDYTSDYIMIKEGNISFCVHRETGLENCLSADVDTEYIINKYNCTSCLINHLVYHSKFYERDICQNVFEEIKTSQNFSLNYGPYYSRVDAIEGKCQNSTLFTPDGKYCYKCNDYIGMPGCNSECSFSLERKDIIKCLDGCKPGYIESSEGICKYCSNINSGCEKCHYDEYPTNYLGIKRKRKFICDKCFSNYVKKDDKCIRCNSIENGCEQCIIKNNEFKCKRCYSNYILDEKGHCNYCEYNSFIFGKKCIKCNDVNQGGIEGCYHCNIYENKTSCDSCDEGYIFLRNNGTCLKISENNELKRHYQCSKISLENNKFYCLQCRDYRFSILKGENESICIYLPELNGYPDDDYYDYADFYHDNKSPNIDNIYKFYYNNYIINYFSPCLEVINIGTEDNPLYSCTKCYDFSYLFTEEKANISYCIYYYNVDNYEETLNCIEKKIKIIDKGVKFTCINCEKDNILIYHEIDKVNYCKYYSPTVIINTTNLTDIISEVNTTSNGIDSDFINNLNSASDMVIPENIISTNINASDGIESDFINNLNSASDMVIPENIISTNINSSNGTESDFINNLNSASDILSTGNIISTNINASDGIESDFINNLNSASDILSTGNIIFENISDKVSLDTDKFESDTNNLDLNETTESITQNKIKICMATKCKICKKDDEYFCDICELEDYVVNNITGACMKKIESVPAIIWKDIFRLEMNSQKEINGKAINGPKLNLRGITNSQINTGHAFIIYLIFKIKQPIRVRNLENSNDTIVIKAICEISKEVEENKNEANTVDYECIGDANEIDLSNYTLKGINTGNDETFSNSNLKELVESKDLTQLDNNPTVEFTMNEINNYTSNNYNFNIKIEGKIDDNLNEGEINEKFKINEINETSNCTFVIRNDKKADLNCKLNIEKYKKIHFLTFNTSKIPYENEYNVSFVNLSKIYLINALYNNSNSKKETKNKTGIIVGSIVGAIIIVILSLIIAYICWRKKKKINTSKEPSIQSITGDRLFT